jgi:hypothetical protein
MGSQNIELCGWILMFLSQVFPIGGRGGDNLRESEANTGRPSPTDSETNFYHMFWTLQLPFSRLPFFADPTTFPTLKQNVDKVLPVIKEASAKERAMMGSKSLGTRTRKREDELTQRSYFLAQFLPSPDLFDLEVCFRLPPVMFVNSDKDSGYEPRRQVIFWSLIHLQHLLTFTKDCEVAAVQFPTQWCPC